MKFFLICLLIATSSFSKETDFKGLSFLDQNLRLGLGLSYSKLEANSDIGNYYLLSQSNPRFELSYDSGVYDQFRQRFVGYFLRELFRPENNSLRVKSKDEQNNFGLSWQPMWVSDGQGFSYGLKLAVKSATIISEIPNLLTIDGDISTRYSAESGVCINWFGQTVSKFPLSLGLEVLYSQGLYDRSVLSYYNGLIYRFSIEFDFKKKTLFSGWNLKGFYSYEDIQNSYSRLVDKELGLALNRIFIF